jgi:hypothetical protein
VGRSLPSATQLAFDEFAELRPLYGALRRSDQLILDRFFEQLLQHRAAIANATSLLPMEVMPLVLLLEERKRNNRMYDELCGQIDRLERKLRQLEMQAPSTPALVGVAVEEPR